MKKITIEDKFYVITNNDFERIEKASDDERDVILYDIQDRYKEREIFDAMYNY